MEEIATATVFAELRTQWDADITPDVERAHTLKPTMRLVHCATCGLEHFDPVVPGSPAFYSQLADVDYYPSRWEFGVVAHRLRPTDTVLDLGAGDGTFLAAIRSRVSRVVGVDHSAEAIRRLRERGIPGDVGDFASHISDLRGAFSVVTAFQTVEHVADVAEVVEPALAALAPGGRLFLSTPNRERAGMRAVEPLDWPPHHLSRWAREQWGSLAERFELRLVGVTLEEPDFSTAAAAMIARVATPLDRLLPHRTATVCGKALRRALLTQRRYEARRAVGSWSARGVPGHTMLAELVRP